MGAIRGQREWQKFQRREGLTRKEAVLANCYQCNGMEDSAVDCRAGARCPFYGFSPYGRRYFDMGELTPQEKSEYEAFVAFEYT